MTKTPKKAVPLRSMRTLPVCFVATCSIGCVLSSDVEPIGAGEFVVTGRTGDFGPDVLTELMKKANAYCAKAGTQAQIVNQSDNYNAMQAFGPRTGRLYFTCQKTPVATAALPAGDGRRESEPKVSTVGAHSTRFGTAFFVNGGGMAVTNAHVVQKCTSLEAIPAGTGPAAASVVALDVMNDLAVVKVSAKTSTFASIRTQPAVRQGERVVVYGFPLFGVLASTGNLAIGNVSSLAGLGDDTSRLQISAPVQPGNSGGPALDEGGSVIGVVDSKLDAINAAAVTGDIVQNVNFAIKAAVLVAFLDANGIGYTAQPKRLKTLSTEDIADAVKAFTLVIRCNLGSE